MKPNTPDFTLDEVDAAMREHGIGEDGFVYASATGEVIGGDVQQATPDYRECFLDQVNHVARLLRYADRAEMRDHTVHTIHDLKVDIEQATNTYVTNGSLLVAAILLGISVKRTEDHRNAAYIGISRRHKFRTTKVA